MPDKDGRLTRKEMESAIVSGGSVLVGGQVVNRLAGLPESAEEIDEKIAELQLKKGKLPAEAKPAKGK